MFLLKTHRNLEQALKCVHTLPTITHFFSYSQANSKLRNQSELSDKIKQSKTTSAKTKKFSVDYTDGTALGQTETKNAPKIRSKKTVKKKDAASDKLLVEKDTFFEEKIEKFKLNETERLKLISAQNANKDEKSNVFKGKIISNEKEFLLKASFEKHNNLDSVGQEYLSKYRSLSKVSTDPKHLTILHSELAEKTAQLLYDKYGVMNNQKRLFIDLNAGVGLVTQKLINIFEKKQDFSKKIIAIEHLYGKEVEKMIKNTNNHQVSLIKPKIKDMRYQLSQEDLKLLESSRKEFAQELAPVIYGIIPWNNNGFVSSLFKQYVSENFFFEHLSVEGQKIWPEFLLYLSEYQIAKLNLNWEKKYLRLNQQYAVLNRLYCETKVLAQEDVEFFFPYPQSSLEKTYQKSLNFKKMYLVQFKFKSEKDPILETLAENKELFNKFVQYILKEPNTLLSQILHRICLRKVSRVFSLGSEIGGNFKSGILPMREYEPHQIYCLFRVLYKNPELLSTASSLEEMFSLKQTVEPRRKRQHSLSEIKSLNKEYSGRLVLPPNDETQEITET